MCTATTRDFFGPFIVHSKTPRKCRLEIVSCDDVFIAVVSVKNLTSFCSRSAALLLVRLTPPRNNRRMHLWFHCSFSGDIGLWTNDFDCRLSFLGAACHEKTHIHRSSVLSLSVDTGFNWHLVDSKTAWIARKILLWLKMARCQHLIQTTIRTNIRLDCFIWKKEQTRKCSDILVWHYVFSYTGLPDQILTRPSKQLNSGGKDTIRSCNETRQKMFSLSKIVIQRVRHDLVELLHVCFNCDKSSFECAFPSFDIKIENIGNEKLPKPVCDVYKVANTFETGLYVRSAKTSRQVLNVNRRWKTQNQPIGHPNARPGRWRASKECHDVSVTGNFILQLPGMTKALMSSWNRLDAIMVFLEPNCSNEISASSKLHRPLTIRTISHGVWYSILPLLQPQCRDRLSRNSCSWSEPTMNTFRRIVFLDEQNCLQLNQHRSVQTPCQPNASRISDCLKPQLTPLLSVNEQVCFILLVLGVHDAESSDETELGGFTLGPLSWFIGDAPLIKKLKTSNWRTLQKGRIEKVEERRNGGCVRKVQKERKMEGNLRNVVLAKC